MSGDATFYILISSTVGRIVMGWLADKFNKKFVMAATYALVAGTIPLLPVGESFAAGVCLHLCHPVWLRHGADYMLIPLMAAEQFGGKFLGAGDGNHSAGRHHRPNLVPYLVARIQQATGNYSLGVEHSLYLAAIGTVAVLLLPRGEGKEAKKA